MKRLFFRVFALALAGVVALLGLLAWFAYTPVVCDKVRWTSPSSRLGMRQVARQLTDAGIDTWPFALVMLARVTRQANGIKAGSYEVEAGVTPLLLLDKLTRGDVTRPSWRSLRAGTSASSVRARSPSGSAP
jgi:UPF0755 protein